MIEKCFELDDEGKGALNGARGPLGETLVPHIEQKCHGVFEPPEIAESRREWRWRPGKPGARDG